MAKRKVISQREARALRAEVQTLRDQLERQRNKWVRDFPGGAHIASVNYASDREFVPAVIANSRLLGHAVVCTTDGAQVRFYALPLAGVRG